MSNIGDLALQIFSNEPLGPHSIPMEINVVDDSSHKLRTNYRDVFEILLQFFHKGLVVKYGDSKGHVNLGQLVEADFAVIKQYFHSIGFDVTVDICELPIPKSFIEEGAGLAEFAFYLKVGFTTVYIVRFDFLPRI